MGEAVGWLAGWLVSWAVLFVSLLRLSWADSDLAGADCHDPSAGEVCTVSGQRLDTGCALISCRNADQTNDSRMRLTLDYGALAEILIQRDEDTIILMGETQNSAVARVA